MNERQTEILDRIDALESFIQEKTELARKAYRNERDTGFDFGVSTHIFSLATNAELDLERERKQLRIAGDCIALKNLFPQLYDDMKTAFPSMTESTVVMRVKDLIRIPTLLGNLPSKVFASRYNRIQLSITPDGNMVYYTVLGREE